MQNEFSRILRLDQLPEIDRALAITADEAERAALTERFGLIALSRLEASGITKRTGAIVHVAGRLIADVEQPCVATGDPVPAHIDTPFALRFIPEEMDAAQEELELSEEDCDTLPYEGGAIDIGEAVAETLSLSLDPFPRSPGADAALRAAGVKKEGEEEPSGPFAALKGLLKE